MNALMKTSGGILQVSMAAKLLSKRLITIRGEITEDKAMDFVSQIIELNMESEEPIIALINSMGGEINSGLLMYDAIVGSKAPIRMICTGRAYSMGAVLFASAKERFMLPNSELMFHEPYLGGHISGNSESIKSISDSLLISKKKINKILAMHTGKKLEEIEEAASYDHYFTPIEAIDFKLCDSVISFSEIIDYINEIEE